MPIDPSLLEDAGSGVPVHKFEEVGNVCRITLTSWTRVQDKDFATGDLKTWPDGNPIWTYQIVGTNADGEEERIIARGQLFKELKTKVVPELLRLGDIGGTLAVKFDHTEPAAVKGFSDKKIYAVKYEPPAEPTVSADDF